MKGVKQTQFVRWFEDISIQDVPIVGGKNASLGEMYRHLTKKGVNVPNGFAMTADAYWQFLRTTGLDKQIKKILSGLDVHDIAALEKTGKKIRALILAADIPKEIEQAIVHAYKRLGSTKNIAVAVRSSATAEDLPDASFAGQQETYLNVVGEKALLLATKKCIASLFTDRAISYRETKGFQHHHVALSVTVQIMVRSDMGSSGVMFTVDTESGFEGVTLINSSYGLGEYIVKGRVTPDQFYVFKAGVKKGKKAVISSILGTKDVKLIYGKNGGTKQATVPKAKRDTFSISQEDLTTLTTWGMLIEEHYGKAQDIEWAKDGESGKLYIVQARPETVKSQGSKTIIEQYQLKTVGKELLRGVAVGQKIGVGKVRIIQTPTEMKQFKKGEVLVTRITDPDWEPIMRMASAIVTEQGGKTSHAAIVSRELGVPCIVGAADARKICKNGQAVTVSCAEGDVGMIYKGALSFEVKKTEVKVLPKTKTKIMMNIGDPDNAFALSFLPHDGIGLAREEFIFSHFIRIHPLALIHYKTLKDKKAKKLISDMTRGYKKKSDYCVNKLAEGIARIAVAAYDKPVIIRLSDFKTNEYATLIGGKEFEPKEENPMIGWRGASRYYSKEYKEAFGLECAAIKKVREDWGLTNVIVMIPFCRTPEEGRKVLKTMESFGLKQGENGLQVYVMCEIPSNVILAEDFAQIFDGFSIGSNDLTQLALGIDRDSALVSHIYDEQDETVKKLIQSVIKVAHKHKKKIGICGQAPSDSPEFAEWIVKQGIDSISINPDKVIETKTQIAALEKTLGKKGKKTNKPFLGLVVAFGLLAAGILSVGAGCVSPTQDIAVHTDNYISPAAIRERTVEKTTQKKEEEFANRVSVFEDKTFANLTLSFPSTWATTRWPNGVVFEDRSSEEYVSLFLQLVDHPIDQKNKTTVLVGEKKAWRFEEVIGDGVNKQTMTIIEIPIDEEKIIEINGNGEHLQEILDTIVFLEDESYAWNHWDVREKRVCVQMVTYARKNEEGSCQAFATPCDVPDAWQVCDANDLAKEK